MKFTIEKRGRKITFEEGKTYYYIDRFVFNSKNGSMHFLPILQKIKCEKQNKKEEGVDFYLRAYEHLIPSNLPLNQLESPEVYDPEDWDNLYAFSLEEAKLLLLKRFGSKEEKNWFFQEMFGD